MNQLVFIENQQVVTDSLTIAEMFDKDHDKVVRDIEVQISKLIEANEQEFSSANFGESTYTNERGRTYRKINLSEEGFTIVAMSYTTPEAMKMKVKFIQEFKRMREYIESQQQKKFTAREQLLLIMQANEETAQRVDVIEEKVNELQNNLCITSAQAKALRSKVNEKVHEALGGKGTNAYKHLRKKTYSACWREFWNCFNINEYRELPRVKFEKAMEFLLNWRPNTELHLEIRHYNTQLQLELVH